MTELTTAAHEQLPELSVSPTPPLPDALLDVRAILCRINDIRAFETADGFNQRPQPSPIKSVKVIYENAAVWIAHLQRRNF
jgi:hypothetical protein